MNRIGKTIKAGETYNIYAVKAFNSIENLLAHPNVQILASWKETMLWYGKKGILKLNWQVRDKLDLKSKMVFS